MNLDPIGEKLFLDLERDMPSALVFHSADAALYRAFLALQLGEEMGLSTGDCLAVSWATLGIPWGFLADYDNPWPAAARELETRLKLLNADPEPTEHAEQLLWQADMLQEDPTAAQKLFHDLRFAWYGQEDFFIRMACWRAERKAYKQPLTLLEAYQIMEKRMQAFKFKTEIASQYFNELGKANKEQIQRLLQVQTKDADA